MKRYETKECWVDDCTEVPEEGAGLCSAHSSFHLSPKDPEAGPKRCRAVNCREPVNDGNLYCNAHPDLQEMDDSFRESMEDMTGKLIAIKAWTRRGSTPWGGSIYESFLGELSLADKWLALSVAGVAPYPGEVVDDWSRFDRGWRYETKRASDGH